MDAFYAFELALHMIPVGFHILSVDPSAWVDEVELVVHSTVDMTDGNC